MHCFCNSRAAPPVGGCREAYLQKTSFRKRMLLLLSFYLHDEPDFFYQQTLPGAVLPK
jgi:hypothetical protein